MKRWIIRICLFLLLGAIVNVAVAWGLAIRPVPSRPLFPDDGRFVRRLVVKYELLDTYVEVYPGAFALSQSWHWPGIDSTRSVEEEEYHQALPLWSRCRHEEPVIALTSTGERDILYFEFATGWPLLAVRCWYVDKWSSTQDPRMSSGLLMLPQSFVRGGPSHPTGRVLPFRPICPGFAINTLFYAAILWSLFAAPFALRRRRRIKHGLCPKCAYPIGDSPICTECGQRLRVEE